MKLLGGLRQYRDDIPTTLFTLSTDNVTTLRDAWIDATASPEAIAATCTAATQRSRKLGITWQSTTVTRASSVATRVRPSSYPVAAWDAVAAIVRMLADVCGLWLTATYIDVSKTLYIAGAPVDDSTMSSVQATVKALQLLHRLLPRGRDVAPSRHVTLRAAFAACVIDVKGAGADAELRSALDVAIADARVWIAAGTVDDPEDALVDATSAVLNPAPYRAAMPAISDFWTRTIQPFLYGLDAIVVAAAPTVSESVGRDQRLLVIEPEVLLFAALKEDREAQIAALPSSIQATVPVLDELVFVLSRPPSVAASLFFHGVVGSVWPAPLLATATVNAPVVRCDVCREPPCGWTLTCLAAKRAVEWSAMGVCAPLPR